MLDRCIEEIKTRYKVQAPKKGTNPKRSCANLEFDSLDFGKILPN